MSNGLYIRLLGEPPMPPPDADFSFRIVFEKGQGNPRRIFDAASELIDGFKESDKQSQELLIPPYGLLWF